MGKIFSVNIISLSNMCFLSFFNTSVTLHECANITVGCLACLLCIHEIPGSLLILAALTLVFHGFPESLQTVSRMVP
jgi:hypothetical protein